jgi:NADH-quinone oxidoreductase subunit L
MEAAATFNLRLIPLLPFLGAAALMLFGRKWKRETVLLVAAGAIGGACLVACDAFFRRLPGVVHEGGLTDVVWTWMATGNLKVDLAFRMDALSGLMCLVITFIGFLIHVYSAGYMAHDPDYPRFFAYLNLFCGSMLVLVLGDNLPVMFVGWEGVGLCSYLLIGFWYSDVANARAGKKAFITNRVGDLGFLIGMFLTFQALGTLSLPEITQQAGARLASPFWLDMPIGFWIGLFLFIGATGKSAQIPLYVWLPDAMAGPTPVSALIHAATMVTAGVYLVARLHAVYVLAPALLAIVALVGALTAVFAAVIGFGQNDFKKVLAYSTVSQLGFMFAGVGTANFSAGVFHLFTHAFFKAGLFLCAGSVMHAMSGSGDITKMGGLRKLVPYTHAVFVVCWLAICGVPGFSGFFSKDSIVAGAFASESFGPDLAWVGPTVGSLLLAAALGTAFYMSRLYYLVFTGTPRADAQTLAHVHESPASMVGPLVVLAVGAALAGFVGFPGGLVDKPELNLIAHWLEPAVGPEMHIPHDKEITFMVVSSVLALLGIGMARSLYRGGVHEPVVKLAAAVPGLFKLVQDKFRVDELFAAVIVRPIGALSRGLYRFVDRVLIDQILVGGLTFVVDLLGRAVRSLQPGDGQRYLAVFTIGAAALVYFATRPLPVVGADPVKVTIEGGTTVSVDASRATRSPSRGLIYSFDWDDNGTPEKTGPETQARYTYSAAGKHTIRVTVRDPRWQTSSVVKKTVDFDAAPDQEKRGGR